MVIQNLKPLSLLMIIFILNTTGCLTLAKSNYFDIISGQNNSKKGVELMSEPYLIANNNEKSTKTGVACMKGVFGFIKGDASIAKAAEKGGLTKVNTVDRKIRNVLSIYSSVCTIVRGS